MDKENNTRQKENYLEDLAVIKGALHKAEEELYVEPWAFFVWAFIVLMGVVINIFVTIQYNFTIAHSAVSIWIPTFIFIGIVEIIAWYVKMVRRQMPILSRQFVKLMLMALGYLVAVICVLPFVLKPELPVPGFVLIFTSLYYFIIGEYSHISFMAVAAVVMAAGIVIIVLGLSSFAVYIAAGIIAVLSLIAGGFLGLWQEKKLKKKGQDE